MCVMFMLPHKYMSADIGFYSNSLLLSTSACCRYGSEVFRLCRKQSNGNCCYTFL